MFRSILFIDVSKLEIEHRRRVLLPRQLERVQRDYDRDISARISCTMAHVADVFEPRSVQPPVPCISLPPNVHVRGGASLLAELL